MDICAVSCVLAVLKNSAMDTLTRVFVYTCAFIFLGNAIVGHKVGICLVCFFFKFQSVLQSS